MDSQRVAPDASASSSSVMARSASPIVAAMLAAHVCPPSYKARDAAPPTPKNCPPEADLRLAVLPY